MARRYIITVIVCNIGLLLTACDRSHPSDERLLHVFHAELESFSKLHIMMTNDTGLHAVGKDWVDPDSLGLSPSRIAEYRQLLGSVGCGSMGLRIYRYRPGYFLIASSRGLSVGGGSLKGYCFLPTPPPSSCIVSNLSVAFDPSRRDTYKIYRHITDSWYLFFEFDG